MGGVIDRNVALATWRPQADQEKGPGRCAARRRTAVEHLFARQALPMSWDFGEAIPLSRSTGSFDDRLQIVSRAITAYPVPDEPTPAGGGSGAGRAFVRCVDRYRTNPECRRDGASASRPVRVGVVHRPAVLRRGSIRRSFRLLPIQRRIAPEVNVWLKRTLPGHPLLRDPFDPDNPLSPKTREAVQDETKRQDCRPKDRQWFEETMAKAFAEGRRVLADDGVGCVVFAHKTTEGWEALLSGMIRGGWTITGSWPIATEMATRLRARDSAALATSVHLICRPRPEDAPVGDWADVIRELPRRVAVWMERLQGEGVRGADLVFACVGPALEIYSRFRAVETAEGRTVGLPEYLEKVWEVVGRAALETVLGTAEA